MSNDQIQFDASVGAIIQRIQEETADGAILYSILWFCAERHTMEDISAYFKKITQNRQPLHNCETYVSWLLNLNAVERIDKIFKTTPEGTTAVNNLSPAVRLSALFEKQPEFCDHFIEILHTCVEPKSREDLEELFDNVQTSTGFYSSYFTTELENAGGLVWTGKWETTDSGIALIGLSLNENTRRDV
jgi:hypothetical protein